jgi:hypothetical protein
MMSLAVTTKYKTIPVSDVEGHVLAMVISQGLAFFKNGEMSKMTGWLS